MLHCGFSGITDIQCVVYVLTISRALREVTSNVGGQHFCQIVHHFHSNMLPQIYVLPLKAQCETLRNTATENRLFPQCVRNSNIYYLHAMISFIQCSTVALLLINHV
jgi:hypothetical protein